MRRQPSPATFGSLRATRDAHRLATAILNDRITTLATVTCAGCGQPVAVATDFAHPASAYEGRLVCRTCVRASRVAEELTRHPPLVAPEPPIEFCIAELEQWAREGWLVLPQAPDPRPTFGEWIGRLLRGRRGG